MAASPPDPRRDAPAAGHAPGNPSASDDASRAVAHELANLVDGSMRSLGLGLRKLDEQDAEAHSAEALHQLRTADGALRRMATLLHQWMGRSAGVGGLLATLERGTLAEAVDHAIDMTRASAEPRYIALRRDVAPDAGDLPAGPLYGLLLNALRNAVESIDAADQTDLDSPAAHAGGRFDHHEIVVRAWLDDADVRLTVIDTGAGIAPELVTPDGEFRYGRSTKPGGQGIGLSVAREVVQSLGGQLRLRDRDDDTPGAVLSVRYPRAAVEQAVAADPSTDSPTRSRHAD
ncbi:MAG: ATP-binding protein [Planctomycetota bacterium]